MVVFYCHLVSSSFITLFTYLFLAVLSLHCWAGFSLVAMSGGYSLVAVHSLLFCGFSYGVQALCGLLSLPAPRL